MWQKVSKSTFTSTVFKSVAFSSQGLSQHGQGLDCSIYIQAVPAILRVVVTDIKPQKANRCCEMLCFFVSSGCLFLMCWGRPADMETPAMTKFDQCQQLQLQLQLCLRSPGTTFKALKTKLVWEGLQHETQGTVAQGIWPQGTLWNVSLKAWTWSLKALCGACSYDSVARCSLA